MTKLIRLQVAKIKYTGDSVGDDIRIEVESLDKFVGLNQRLKRGSDRALNVEIGQFFGDGVSFALPVTIRIIERYLVFNDVGSVQKTIKVNLSDPSPQRNISTIEVRERRGYLTRGKAVFAVTLEAEVSDATRYVPDIDESQGFLKIKLEDDKSIESLPAYLKVTAERRDAKREYFRILEGPYRDRSASVSLKEDGVSRLISGVTTSRRHGRNIPFLKKYSFSTAKNISRLTTRDLLGRKDSTILRYPTTRTKAGEAISQNPNGP